MHVFMHANMNAHSKGFITSKSVSRGSNLEMRKMMGLLLLVAAEAVVLAITAVMVVMMTVKVVVPSTTADATVALA